MRQRLSGPPWAGARTWIVGAARAEGAGAPRSLAEAAVGAGLDAVKVSCASDPDALSRECAGRIARVVVLPDSGTVAEVGRSVVSPDAVSVEAGAATDPGLLEVVADLGLPTLLEVNGLTEAQVRAACQRFLPGYLALMWRQARAGASAVETVEELFALLRLRLYGMPVGYASTGGDELSPAVAVGFGAAVVELTFARNALAGRSSDVRKTVALIRRCQLPVDDVASPEALDDLDVRQPSLVATRGIARGEIISAEMVTPKAPSRGLSPTLMPLVIGRRALYDIAQDEPITFGVLDL